jgi:protein tyrosine/serine phosphatase
MKKKFLARSVLALLFVGVLSFAGCNVIVVDTDDYYATISSAGETQTIPDDAIVVTAGTGKTVNFLEAPVTNYIKAMKSVKIKGNDYCFNDEAGAGVAVKDYWEAGTNVSYSKSVYLSWEEGKGPYTVTVSTDAGFETATEYIAAYNYLELTNLYMATTYYWKVKDGNGNTSTVNSFATEDTVRFINAGKVINVRDLGGRMTSSGKRVKQGIIYRGAEMNIQTYTDQNGSQHTLNLGSSELNVLKNQLNIKTELDFRSDAETNEMSRSALGDEITYSRPAISGYTGMFCKHTSNGEDNPTMRTLYQGVLRTLATATEDSAVYFHCWGGADRTGTIAFLVNGLLGVSYTDLLIDFELTTFSNNYRSRTDDPTNWNYFNSMVTQLRAEYQKSDDETISTVIERYMKECLYLTDGDITALKTNLLEK